MKASIVCGILLLCVLLSAAFVPLASAESRTVAPGDVWTATFQDAKKGDVIYYKFAIAQPDGKDRLAFWIEGPDGTRYVEMVNMNSGNGSFKISFNGVWKATLKNYNWYDGIVLTAEFLISSPPQRTEEKDPGVCIPTLGMLGMLAITLGIGLVLMAKKKQVKG